MNSHTQQKRQNRIDIFDGLRGHLLIGMLIAHLSFQKGLEWLGSFHHNRVIRMYDAEFFVLIAGLLVGYLWFYLYKTSDKRQKFLNSRIITIYRYYVISALPFFIIKVANGSSTIEDIFGVLGMQIGGAFSDVLPIYFYCFVLLYPFFVIPVLSRPFVIFVVSAAIYIAAQLTNLNGFFGFSGRFVVFDIAAWQFLFVCSLVVGYHGVALIDLLKNSDSRLILVLILILVATSILLRSNYLYTSMFPPYNVLAENAARMGLHPVYLLRILIFSALVSIILIRNDFWIRPFHIIGNWYFSLSRLLKYYPYGRTCSAAASAFVAAVSVF